MSDTAPAGQFPSCPFDTTLTTRRCRRNRRSYVTINGMRFRGDGCSSLKRQAKINLLGGDRRRDEAVSFGKYFPHRSTLMAKNPIKNPQFDRLLALGLIERSPARARVIRALSHYIIGQLMESLSCSARRDSIARRPRQQTICTARI